MCFLWITALLRELSLEIVSNDFVTKFSYCTSKGKTVRQLVGGLVFDLHGSRTAGSCWQSLSHFQVFHSYTEPRAVWHGTRLSTNVETPSLCLEKCHKELMENSVSQGHGKKAKITKDKPAHFSCSHFTSANLSVAF